MINANRTTQDVAKAMNTVLSECYRSACREQGGELPRYIPALAKVDPGSFGMAIAGVRDGRIAGVGQSQAPFSIQSISKLFALVCAIQDDPVGLWKRVGLEPSGGRFDALLHLDTTTLPLPNPFVNAGALMVTDLLMTHHRDAAGRVREALRQLSDDQGVDYDPAVAESELANGHRNAALAHHLASLGWLTNSVECVLDQYYKQCAIVASCESLAFAGLFLASDGRTYTGDRVLTVRETRVINALLTTCGVYDGVTSFAARVGMPAKSGVGGGILAIAPGFGAVCSWGPLLDKHGTSCAGQAALETFAALGPWARKGS